MVKLSRSAASASIPPIYIYTLLFVVAFVPRLLALDVYVAPDEGKWIYRSAYFLRALLAGNLAETSSIAATPEVEVLAPAVPTMWTGALGLWAKYWLAGGQPADSLAAYLDAIPADTEKIPLDFYPWTRFPTVLLTSLSIPVFYYLLSCLIPSSTAWLVVTLLALDPFFIGLSRVIHHDALVSIFIFAAVLSLLVYRQQNRSRFFLLWSGLAGGLALLTKPTALYLVTFVGLFLLWQIIAAQGSLSAKIRSVIIEAMIWGGVAALTFIAVWPAMWVAPVDTLAALLERALNAAGGSNDYSLLPAPGTPLPELGFLFYPVNWLFKSTLPLWVGLIALAVAWPRGWLKQERMASSDSSSAATSPATIWTAKWLIVFVLIFLLLLIPADTRDIRYFLPAVPALYGLAAIGIIALTSRLDRRPASPLPTKRGALFWIPGLLLLIQLGLVLVYFPYYVDYWNPAAGGPWLAPRLVKIGSGEGLDQVGRYLDQKPNAAELTVATSFWESFAPFFSGHYTKAHYDETADYILIYIRQIQNRNPFPEYWTYFSARRPEYKVTLVGLDVAWLYPGPQLYVVRDANFADDLILRGYRLGQPVAQSGQNVILTLVWANVTPALASRRVTVQLIDAADVIWAKASGPVLASAGPSPVEGHYQLDIPADMPRGDYQLWVSLAEVSHQVGVVPVRRLEQPPVSRPAAVNFGDLVTFAGADLSNTTIAPGQPLDLTLLWQARQPIPRSFTTFVHVVDEAGQIWGQVDRLPGDGQWLTQTWDKGEWISDRFQLSLKPDTPAGRYTLLVGLYDSQTLERLPVVGLEQGQTVFELTSLKVLSE